MWNDIKMWLFLRLLYSELNNYFDGEYGEQGVCSFYPFKKFRDRDSFMLETQKHGVFLLFMIFPFKLHKYLVKKKKDFKTEEVEITEQTKNIFSSAEQMGYIQHPMEKIPIPFQTIRNRPSVNASQNYIPVKNKIAISYNEGNRFISWSGLVSFVYLRHLPFFLLLWTAAVYVTAEAIGLISLLCNNYQGIPMC